MWQAYFFGEFHQIYTPLSKTMLPFFCEKVFLKGTSPVDLSLQQHKTVLQIAKYFFFWGFEDLPHYNSYYTFLTELGELILIITIRMEHATCASALVWA